MSSVSRRARVKGKGGDGTFLSNYDVFKITLFRPNFEFFYRDHADGPSKLAEARQTSRCQAVCRKCRVKSRGRPGAKPFFETRFTRSGLRTSSVVRPGCARRRGKRSTVDGSSVQAFSSHRSLAATKEVGQFHDLIGPRRPSLS